MDEQLVLALEERVLRLVGEYERLLADHGALQARVNMLEERQQMAAAKIDRLLQRVQGS